MGSTYTNREKAMSNKKKSGRIRADGLPSNNVHPQKKSHPWARSPSCLTLRALKADEFNDRKEPLPANVS